MRAMLQKRNNFRIPGTETGSSVSGTIMAIALILFALPLIKIVRNWIGTRVSERPL